MDFLILKLDVLSFVSLTLNHFPLVAFDIGLCFVLLFLYLDIRFSLPIFLPSYSSQELMNKPVSLSCGHSSCKACLLQSVANGRKTCPLQCRVIIDASNLNPNIAVKALISKIKVCCTNSGCSWTGQHSEKESHWGTCPFMLVECPNGCIGNHQRSALAEHLAACPYENVSCMFCRVGVPRFRLDTHVENCTQGPLLCPLQCGERLPR